VVTSFSRTNLQINQKAIETEDKKDIQHIVGVGKKLNDIDIRIVNDNDRPLDEGSLGHIQIKGASVTCGYYNDEKATKDTFCGEWLRTGDQGFFYKGNLYISGRYKDIIFINGKNFYANDIENLVLQLDDLTFGKIVIGGTFDENEGQDKLLVFLVGSPNKNLLEKYTKIKNLLQDSLGILPRVLVPIKSNQIPRTSSGKIQRYKLISSYLKGEFDDSIKQMSLISQH
jgi:acyl-CoA synthetase (AMP-forming)/AMP-acid ligase II